MKFEEDKMPDNNELRAKFETGIAELEDFETPMTADAILWLVNDLRVVKNLIEGE